MKKLKLHDDPACKNSHTLCPKITLIPSLYKFSGEIQNNRKKNPQTRDGVCCEDEVRERVTCR